MSMAKTAWQATPCWKALFSQDGQAQDMAEHDLKNASPQNAIEVADYLASHVDFTPYQDIQTLAKTYHHLATQAITLGQNPEGRKEFLYV